MKTFQACILETRVCWAFVYFPLSQFLRICDPILISLLYYSPPPCTRSITTSFQSYEHTIYMSLQYIISLFNTASLDIWVRNRPWFSSNCDHCWVVHSEAWFVICAGWFVLESWGSSNKQLHPCFVETRPRTVRQSLLSSCWLHRWIKNNWRRTGTLFELLSGSRKGKYCTVSLGKMLQISDSRWPDSYTFL